MLKKNPDLDAANLAAEWEAKLQAAMKPVPRETLASAFAKPGQVDWFGEG